MLNEKKLTPILKISNLACERDDKLLFSSLSFNAFSGELWQLTGHNGAGKTSLLKILAGLLWYPEGKVSWQSQHDASASVNEYLGYIGHQSGLRGELTAEENLHWLAALHGERYSRVNEVLTALGLRGYTDVPLARLSAGQKRRVALSRLWLSDKQVWLLDEPFTAIDRAGVAMLEARLIELVANHKLVIYTSHHQVNATAKRIELAHGKAKVVA